MGEILYKAKMDVRFNDSLFDVLVCSGHIWTCVAIKPNGIVLRRANVCITIRNETVDLYFTRI